MKYQLSNDTWNEEEKRAVLRVLNSNMFTMGSEVARFEKAFCAYFGCKYAVMTNSGSSANLLAISALICSGKLKRGDEVLVPAVSWSTTYFPLEQCGLKIRLVDIDKDTLNFDLEQLEKAITPDSKAVFAVNLLGNPNDFEMLQSICQKYNLLLLEDNCESMGAVFDKKKTGTFGILGTFSTFYSHHICTMEGGVTVTDDEKLYHYMLSIRAHGWTRQLPKDSTIYKKNENDFYESFQFIVPGYNLRPLEMEAAVGTEQLSKLDAFINTRRTNADYFSERIVADNRFYIQRETGMSSWFGFALILKKEYAGTRDKIITALRAADIEVRPIVAGNFARQPAFRYMNASIFGDLANADYIHDNGFFVGNHSINMKTEIDYLIETLTHIK